MALVVTGRLVPLDRADPSADFTGRIYLGDDGTVDRIVKGNGAAPAGFDHAPTVDVGDALVAARLDRPPQSPRLQHVAAVVGAVADDAVSPSQLLAHRADATTPSITLAVVPCSPNAEPEALAGVCAGRAPSSAARRRSRDGRARTASRRTSSCATSTTRRWARTSHNLIFTSVSNQDTAGVSAKMAQASDHDVGFVYHCAEGQPGSVVASEFVDAANAGCLREERSSPSTATRIARRTGSAGPRTKAGAVAWSPFSNSVALRGRPTDITAARAAERARSVSAPTGGHPGTKHVLGEIKVAKIVSGTNQPRFAATRTSSRW